MKHARHRAFCNVCRMTTKQVWLPRRDLWQCKTCNVLIIAPPPSTRRAHVGPPPPRGYCWFGDLPVGAYFFTLAPDGTRRPVRCCKTHLWDAAPGGESNTVQSSGEHLAVSLWQVVVAEPLHPGRGF